MYGIFTYIWLIFMINVGKYTIHGCYGLHDLFEGKKQVFLSAVDEIRFVSLQVLRKLRRWCQQPSGMFMWQQWIKHMGCLGYILVYAVPMIDIWDYQTETKSRYGCGSKCKVWIKPRSHTRSRPPIQTFRKDLIQTFDPDLWNDIIFWWVYVWSSDGVMFLGFLLCSYSPCQAAKQQTVVKPRCRAVGLPSCKATLLSSPAAKLQLLCIQAVKLPSWHCCKL